MMAECGLLKNAAASFRGGAKAPNPESRETWTQLVQRAAARDSGFALRAPRNDGKVAITRAAEKRSGVNDGLQ